jgi:hypothetical protein
MTFNWYRFFINGTDAVVPISPPPVSTTTFGNHHILKPIEFDL